MAWIMLAALLTLPACGSATVKTSAEAVRLREQAVELQNRIASLERRNRELESELSQAASPSDARPAEIRDATPRIVEISIDRLSFARDTNGDGQIDQIVVYVKSQDGLGRFEQLVGSISVMAVLLPTEGDPIVIGRRTLTPAELREAYRYSFMGVHYTIELPIESPLPGSPGFDEKDALVRASYTDGRSEQVLSAERRVPLNR